MASPFSLTIEMGTEVKKKIFGKSNLKKLLDKLTISLGYDLVGLYLESPDFPLKPSGTLSFLKEPIELGSDILYIGELSCEVPNGIGFQLDSAGNYYEGNFLESRFHGLGRLFKPNGWIIQGKFKEGDLKRGTIDNFFDKKYQGCLVNFEPNGEGYEESDDYTYSGEFFRGKKHGKGKIQWKNGIWYEGNFIMGRIEGKGKQHSPENEYEGDWKANKMHGLGVITWPNGDRYEGGMVLGNQEGYGIFTSASKKYSGYWKAGKEHGKGKIEENGEIFEGVWENGELENRSSILCEEKSLTVQVDIESIQIPDKISEKYEKVLSIWKKIKKFKYDSDDSLTISDESWKPAGKGMYFGETGHSGQPEGKGIWISGSSIYEGKFHAGERNGFGRSINLHKEVYVGYWISGKKSGFGVFKNFDSVYVGEWENNKFSGKGRISTPRFNYDGEWVQGLQHGHGIMQHPDKTVYEGDFKTGVISGYGTMRNARGKCVYGIWEEGRVTKVIKKFFEEKGDQRENDNGHTEDNDEILKLKELLV